MQSVRSALALLVVFLIICSRALAQSAQTAAVPRVINLTGVFQPVDGQPPRAVETVTLALYTEPTGGAPLWQEVQSVAVDAKGRYALLLGATSAEGIPAAVVAAGAQWLGTKFDRPGEVEGPRLQLTSVPYTLRAADADTLGGRPASAYLLAPTTSSGKSQLTTTGQASASAMDPGTSTPQDVQPGTVNFLAKYVTAADVGNSAVFENAGRVGIGTQSPLDSLHLNFTNTNGAVTGLAVQNLGNTATSYSGMLFYDQNGATAQFQGFNNVTHEYRINNIAQNAGVFNGSINFMIGSTSRFLVTTAGNIGIGTTSPGAGLDVSNALTTNPAGAVFTTSFSAPSTGSGFVGRKARGTVAAPTASLNGDTLVAFLGRGYGATGFGTGSAGMVLRATEDWTDTAQGTAINFNTTPNTTSTAITRMTLDSAGNLGVGTTTPGGGFEVSNATSANPSGNITNTTFSPNALGSIFTGRKARGTSSAPTAVLNGDNLAIFTGRGFATAGFGAGASAMVIRASEDWTATAQGTSMFFTTTANGTTAPINRLAIDPLGNVGIGTNLPFGALNILRTSGGAKVYVDTLAGEAGFVARRIRGAVSAPTATLAGDELGEFGGGGYDGATFTDLQAGFAGFAWENWTSTARGSALVFGTTPVGTLDAQVVMSILPDGKVGIGTPEDINGFPTATDKLQIFGDARVGDAGTNGCLKRFDGTGLIGTCASDRRFKKDITPFDSVLAPLAALQPVHYYWRAGEFPERHFGNAQTYGLIAQDVEQVLPELVVTNDDGYKAVDYSKLPLLTIQAVKELKSENDTLKERVANLERIVKELLTTTTRE